MIVRKEAQMDSFSGLQEDTYTFFWELAFHNEISWFEENRSRYEAVVKKPLLQLAVELAPTALEVDSEFLVRPAAVVSRIRRDTRYAPVDAPFRDHAYLTYRYPGVRIGESFSLYAEFLRDSYGYGMGMYSDNPPFMDAMRKRILANQEAFLKIIQNRKLRSFVLEGVEYKRPKYPDAPAALQPWLQKKRLYFSYSSKEISRTLHPALLQEIQEGFLALKPLYRFIMGL